MKIYFIRATINPSLATSLPDAFIVESVKEDMFNEMHAALPGWESLEEEEFAQELAKNDIIYKEFVDAKEAAFRAAEAELERQKLEAYEAILAAQAAEDQGEE